MWDEERDSWDENVGRAPYHAKEWARKRRLPGPVPLPDAVKFGGGVRGKYRGGGSGARRAAWSQFKGYTQSERLYLFLYHQRSAQRSTHAASRLPVTHYYEKFDSERRKLPEQEQAGRRVETCT
ncbi:hypothetical protein GGX14DRAFT_387778 [Mycena pura]|uniref:Uncharacterized protein n=1 Tax=Mycena pura TaxID=153505 RepID=A0AAD7E248_9AGAR|nr:hypothetical protein GGX14DRAFT_387778 [Mycena pura]